MQSTRARLHHIASRAKLQYQSHVGKWREHGVARRLLRGTVVVLDRELGRIDISAGGAKLICRIDEMAAASDMLAEASVVRVTGRLRKQQRRTFLEAVDVYIVHPG